MLHRANSNNSLFLGKHAYARYHGVLYKYSTLVGGNCGPSSENPANAECVTIGQCTKEVNGHLTFCKVSDDVCVDSEFKLLLARAGRVSALLS